MSGPLRPMSSRGRGSLLGGGPLCSSAGRRFFSRDRSRQSWRSLLIIIIIGMRPSQILLVIALCLGCFSIKNPGLLLQVPTQMQLPVISLGLPIHIAAGISIQKLELTDVVLRDLDYSWQLASQNIIVSIPETVVSFHWDYGQDSGIGTFSETHLAIKIKWEPTMDSHNRFKANIISTKLTNDEQKSKIKINLGGNVKETVVIEVTNLILNHAKVTFQQAITNAIIGAVNSLTQSLSNDVKVYCPIPSKCIYLNTTLNAKPIITNGTLLVQVNAAPYEYGSHSQGFEPSSALFKTPSNQIAFQIHQDVLTHIVELVNKISPLSFTIKTTEISSTADIDSQTLSVVFPKMRNYNRPRPVLLIIDVLSAQIQINKGTGINILGSGTVSVATDATSSLYSELEPYINPTKGFVSIQLTPVVVGSRANVRLQKIEVEDIQFNPKDIEEGYVNPGALTIHLQTLLAWAASGSNGSLNEKIVAFEYLGLRVQPTVAFLAESMVSEIKFGGPTQMDMIDQ